MSVHTSTRWAEASKMVLLASVLSFMVRKGFSQNFHGRQQESGQQQCQDGPAKWFVRGKEGLGSLNQQYFRTCWRLLGVKVDPE
jgi:hypothetical protein